MHTHLEGKTVLIIDATADLGRATALAFAGEGANLVLASAGRPELLAQAAQEAEGLGVRALAEHCDLGVPDQVRNLIQQGTAQFGHLDVVVNNSRAGPSLFSLEDLPFDQWRAQIREQVTGALLLCQGVLPGMIGQQWGRIINYIGLAGFQGANFADSAIELGLVGLTRGIAREYGRYNITANCIGPAGIETEKENATPGFSPGGNGPLPRLGKPEEVAFLAVCLASENAGYVTGQCLLANGGRYFL